MLWQETSKKKNYQVPDRIVDLSFSIRCKYIAADHMQALYDAIVEQMPWIENSDGLAIHPVHVAESGNGWMRPDEPDAVLFPSRRTRLQIRVPEEYRERAQALSGKTLEVGAATILVGEARTKLLMPSSTIFCRHLITPAQQSEADFLDEVVSALKSKGILLTKALCGISTPIQLEGRLVHTRRLLLADLSKEDSIAIQESGMGERRVMGFGLFIPHKGIAEVTKDLD